MHPEILSALAEERRRDMVRLATRPAREAGESVSHVAGTGASARRLPRYRVQWSRTTLPGIGAAGRRERSWVIVISATRGL